MEDELNVVEVRTILFCQINLLRRLRSLPSWRRNDMSRSLTIIAIHMIRKLPNFPR